MSRVAFSFFNINIYWYSLCILIGIVLALVIVYLEWKKEYNINDLVDLSFYTIIFGIIGARLYYVLFNLDYYLSNILEIFMVWNGGLAIHGGIIAGLITIFIYSKKKKINMLHILDIVSPALLIAQAIGRWGNFFNQEAYGGVVSRIFLEKLHIPNFIINNMYINGMYHHPTFLYESIWNILGFILMLIIRKSIKYKKGNLAATYFIWYGIGRLFIESLRTDSLMLGNLRVAQLVSIILIIIGVIIIIRNRGGKK